MSAEDTTQTKDQTDDPPPPESLQERGGVVKEIGGPKGPEPIRFGDWEQGGRCTDF